MKIDRRCFLSLGAGAIVGTTFSPLPWKLMDDISIWTQNWPWTPNPAKGPEYVDQSVCMLCPGGCGINVRRVEDRVIKIEGRADYPVNKGSLCPLGISGAQFLYGPSRVTSPMKRVGERGDGKYEPISWEEAVGTVSKNLKELRNRGKAHTVACISSSDRGTVPYLIDRFLTAYGSPNFTRTASFLDAHELALHLTQGRQGSIGFDIENADFILSFGCGLLDGWGAPGRLFHKYGQFDKNNQLVQVEPRLSDTAVHATKWLAAKPGTNGVLALSLAHVIVRDKLYNKNFIENFAFGFEDWTDDAGNQHTGFKTLVQQYPPSKAARLTGLKKSQIEWLARAFAKAQRPVAISGHVESGSGNVNETLAVHALNALVGNVNKAGGMTVLSEPGYLNWSEMEVDRTASKGRQQPRVDRAGSETYPNTRYLIHQVPEVINATKGESPIQALLVTDANPLYTLEDTAATKEAFSKIPFIVSFSSEMDETAAFSDILLPNHNFLERYQDVPTPEGMAERIIGLTKPVVSPQYDTRHLGDSILQIAKSLGGTIESAFPWKDYETFLEETLTNQWDALTEKGYWIDPEKPAAWKEAFQTRSGKYEFYSSDQTTEPQKEAYGLLDYTPTAVPGSEKDFPLVMVPYLSLRLAGGPIAGSPFMIKTVDSDVLKDKTAFIEINPQTAKQYKLSDGDLAVLTTPKGDATVRVNLYDGIMPEMIALPRGLGHTAHSRYIADKGVNVNSLLETVADPFSGLNTAWGIRASLKKA